jgi:glycosyltransferase involved in cell wall biosynthesis
MTTLGKKPLLVIVGQTPPPWHGQAVATQLLFDAVWEGYDVRRVRMAFSSEMEEIGRMRFSKGLHMLNLWSAVRNATKGRKDGILLYPPASPNWVPLLRDMILLPLIKSRFRTVVYLYHAGGVGEWCSQSTLRGWIARIAYGCADLNLEVARENPAPHEVLGARRWAWTPYGVQVPPLAPRAKSHSGPTVVLFVGSLQEGKGVIEVLRTASLLKSLGKGRDFLFKIVGRWFSAEFEQEARQMLGELGLSEMVEFPGQLTGQAKWQAYAEGDVFFFPTHYASEAFPLVLIEALGSGLPVVTTRWRGIPDLLEGCKVARLCPIHSPDEYAEALIEFQEQAKSGLDFSKESKSFYEERYLPENFLAQIHSLISATVSETCIPPSPETGQRKGHRDMWPTVPAPHGDKRPVPSDGKTPSKDTDALTSPLGPEVIRAAFPPHTVEHSAYAGDQRAYPAGSLPKISISAYLADQNPGHGRSFGISRMSKVILDEMAKREDLGLKVLCTLSSLKGPEKGAQNTILPWSTRSRIMRLLTDQLHPVLAWFTASPDIWYFPKGFLPRFNLLNAPTVVTVHDTIIQYYQDYHPGWRKPIEYAYWKTILTFTLKHADAIFTVSEISKKNIRSFMLRQGLPEKEILVTYEPCFYEQTPQPEDPPKKDYVVHLASREPHKHTHKLVRWWIARSESGGTPPLLTLVGQVPLESEELIAAHPFIRRHNFLNDDELQTVIREARALILPSEIEGFGLPAIEAYYLGTPVCFVKGTSVEEILGESTSVGAFQLAEPDSLWDALDQVLAMPAPDVRRIGLELRERFAAAKVVDRMIEGFRRVAVTSRSN